MLHVHIGARHFVVHVHRHLGRDHSVGQRLQPPAFTRTTRESAADPTSGDAAPEFKEGEHPRGGDPKHPGRFSKGKGGGARAATAKPAAKPAPSRPVPAPTPKPGGTGPAATVKLSPAPKGQRAWSGKSNEKATRLSKQEAGALGENIALAFLKSKGLADAQPLNMERSNFPLDLIGDHEVYEIKTGQVSNSASAAQWRATIGQPGKAESEWLKTATPEAKAAHNAAKNAEIIKRKEAATKLYSKKLGTPVHGKTLTLIIDPDTGLADVHIFDGFHQRIGYNSEAASSGYVGSFRYQAPGESRAA